LALSEQAVQIDECPLLGAKQTSIPIVFVVGGDPVKLALVQSLNHPGSNATGTTILTTSLEPKRLGLLREMLPPNATVGVFLNPALPLSQKQSQEVEDAAASSPRSRSIAPNPRFIRVMPPRGSAHSPWRDDLDEKLGAALRAAIVTPLFRHDPDIALRVLTTGMGDKAYRSLRPLLRIFPSFYRLRHQISEGNLERDRAIVAAALDRIEHERQGKAYLVGQAFTVADLTDPSVSTRLFASARLSGQAPAPVPAGFQGPV
jgi:hypothetical protein